ncbi:hypothetical protein MMC11_006648 [Xylographa trunciseda]|nr:hypothetical protein [Xylographa trunciseda]
MLEKNHQVGIMGRIYTQATDVLIWLGQEDETSSHSMRFIQQVAAVVDRHFSTDWTDPSFVVDLLKPRNPEEFRKEFDHINKIAEWTSLQKLFHRAWFSRRWVAQEAILARRATVYCGASNISWREFLSATTLLQLYRYAYASTLDSENNPAVAEALQQGWMRTSAWRPVRDNQKYPLTHPFLRFTGFECNDSRDYIFALLSLINFGQPVSFEPDYTKDTASVYKDFATYCLRYSKKLSVLNLAGNYFSSEINRLHLPSWVPNWQANTLERPFLIGGRHNQFTAGSEDHPILYVDDNQTKLHIKGIFLSKVKKISRLPQSSRTSFERYKNGFHEWRDLMQLQSGKEIYLTGERFSHALARTLIADEVFPITRLGLTDFFERASSSWALYIVKRLIFEFHEPLSSTASHADVLQSLVPRLERPSMSKALDYLFTSYIILEGRSFVVTESGHIGIGPENAKEGDIVVIFRGGETPFLLRQQDKKLNQFIGECYIHGVMYGEMWNSEASLSFEEFIIQ